MKGYLLDTHVWFWSLLGTKRLADEVVEIIRSSTDDCWLSPISVWEIGMLDTKGKIKLSPDDRSWIDQSFEVLPLRSAPLTHEVARASFLLDLEHGDPADRFLGATARVYELTLVTADRRLLASEAFTTLRAD